jgi:hypothetical protein
MAGGGRADPGPARRGPDYQGMAGGGRADPGPARRGPDYQGMATPPFGRRI